MKRVPALMLVVAGFLHSSFAHADDEPPAAPSKTEMRSPAMVIAGSALSALGTGAIATGIYFLAQTGQCPQSDATESRSAAPPCSFYDGSNRFVGYSALAGGAALLAAGLPLIVVGAWRVPFEKTPGQVGVRVGASDIRLSVTF